MTGLTKLPQRGQLRLAPGNGTVWAEVHFAALWVNTKIMVGGYTEELLMLA